MLYAAAVCWICDQSHHAVVHDFIPVFPCDNPEENSDSLARCGEVGVPANRRDVEMCISRGQTNAVILSGTNNKVKDRTAGKQ